MNNWLLRRPQLAWRFTILTGPGLVRLIAGEDLRFTLREPELEMWFPAWLQSFDGRTIGEVLEQMPTARQAQALDWIQRLYGERIVVDCPAALGPMPRELQALVTGTGSLVARLQAVLDAGRPAPVVSPESPPSLVHVLCQDRLDYAAALEFNRLRRTQRDPWLWISTGAAERAWVSPLFLADAGPCLECLVRGFQRLSPAPELYEALLEHVRQGGVVEPAAFPAMGLELVVQLTRWKLALSAAELPAAALYRLHVVETDSLEVAAYPVLLDPDCPACGAVA